MRIAASKQTTTEDLSQQRLCCLVCNTALRFFGPKSNFSYWVCDECTTIQLAPVPSRAQVEQAYSECNYSTDTHGQGDPDEVRKSNTRYYESLATALADHRAHGLVIDYGAGWGGLCEVLAKRGFRCRGIELAKNMVDECQRRGLDVVQSTPEKLVEEGQTAGAIVMSGVFEHLLDPHAFLDNAHKILEPGGLLVSMQPTANFAHLLAGLVRGGNKNKTLPSAFWVFDPPWHVAMYSLAAMKKIARSHGFELVEIRFAPQGRLPGLAGLAQVCLETTNRMGWAIVKDRWPLMISHTFVFRKA